MYIGGIAGRVSGTRLNLLGIMKIDQSLHVICQT